MAPWRPDPTIGPDERPGASFHQARARRAHAGPHAGTRGESGAWIEGRAVSEADPYSVLVHELIASPRRGRSWLLAVRRAAEGPSAPSASPVVPFVAGQGASSRSNRRTRSA